MLENYFWCFYVKYLPIEGPSLAAGIWSVFELVSGDMTRAGVGGRAPSGSWRAEDGFPQSQSQRRERRPYFGSICRKRNSVSDFYTTKVTQLYCTSLQVWRAHPLRFEACYRNRFAVISNIKSIKLTDSKFWAFAGCYQEMFLRDGLACEMVEKWKYWWR